MIHNVIYLSNKTDRLQITSKIMPVSVIVLRLEMSLRISYIVARSFSREFLSFFFFLRTSLCLLDDQWLKLT